jgi:uncharacterized membrane protein
MDGSRVDFSPESSPRRASGRLHAIDAVRGVAVLAMIQWHAADAWIAPAVREGVGLRVSRVVGGLAAPAFLFLAGVSLAWSAPSVKGGPWLGGTLRRALRVVLGGYALNLWAWCVDRGAVLQMCNVPVAAMAGGALGAFALATRERPGRGFERLAWLALGTALAVAAGRGLPETTRLGASLLPRLDVLQGIGAALAVTALVLAATARPASLTRAASVGAAAFGVAVLAFFAPGPVHAWLPAGVADWIARPSPGTGVAAAGFPLFPWLGYTLLGASCALALKARPSPVTQRWDMPHLSRPGRLAVAAVLVGIVVWEPSPVVQGTLTQMPWLHRAFRLTFNASMMASAFGAVAWLGPRAARPLDVLALLGRHSLLVYCAHLEFAFGLVGIPVRRALGWPEWSAFLVAVIAAMAGLAWLAESRGRRGPAHATIENNGVAGERAARPARSGLQKRAVRGSIGSLP